MSDRTSSLRPAEVQHFWLEYGPHQLELRPGTLLIGRSGTCQFVLDDGLVSRRHAELTVTDSSVVVRDLGSSNGVFVNEKRIQEARSLEPGDRLVIGKQEMLLRAEPRTESLDAGQRRFTAETLHGFDVPALTKAPEDLVEDPDSTHQGDALELLGSVADKVLALGRGAEAERVLTGCLTTVLEAAKEGTASSSSPERAVLYAIKLAAATGKSRWVDYAIELYRILKRPLPAPAVDQLYTVLRGISGINLQGLRDYVALLRAAQPRFGPSERFLVQRIEGLERLAALK